MTSITAPATATSAVAPASATSGALAKLSNDSNTFLKLLTTQMQNQDPLKPMDTSEYTQQLVQFSQVEQSIQQNQSLKDILAKLSSNDLSNAAALIGKTASFDSSIAGLQPTGGSSWRYMLDRPAQSLVATVSDAAGNTVTTRAVDPAGGRFDWDGTDDQGNRAAPGTYTLSLAAVDAGGSTVPAKIAAQGMVAEVSVDQGQLTLLANGQRYGAASLLQLGSTMANQ
ncbi:flagellar hook assembly protein FlgD [Sphingomonas sp. PAMC 26617]|uniref:flagellar hook assembly protein FlgD n=1 Tax=Sphingomonas sp. PAMC 26617 TaxID=1112216 RepID=UPI000289AC39|nr:flagellar hook capping FlgD N-terminal domain-containing protein [Sphingomonas sp. PAMC 26617]